MHIPHAELINKIKNVVSRGVQKTEESKKSAEIIRIVSKISVRFWFVEMKTEILGLILVQKIKVSTEPKPTNMY